MNPAPHGPCLIVNADDYGYFRCVSRGILECASAGIVTATGVFANASDLAEQSSWLRDCDALDAGVHLNLTTGYPLTADLGKRLARWGGRFPGKFAIASAVLAGVIGTEQVGAEWRAQIERCLERGLRIRFLNSHEHVHSLPSLFRLVDRLADEYGIAHVRLPTARLDWSLPAAALFRATAIRLLETVDRRLAERPPAHFLGLEQSGRLDHHYLERCISQLRPGGVYELMCHPGRLDPAEIRETRLLSYHDWEGELRTFTDPRTRELLASRGVRLVGYRDLAIVDNRLCAAQAA